VRSVDRSGIELIGAAVAHAVTDVDDDDGFHV
jgi:hypothetical protein